MLWQIEGKLGDHHAGELRGEIAEAKAERMVGEELCRLGWSEAELAARRRSDPAKLAIAARLRRETMLPIIPAVFTLDSPFPPGMLPRCE